MGLAVRNPFVDGRDFDAEPYSSEEERVATYLRACIPGVKRFVDPVGVLIHAHARFVAEKRGGCTVDAELPLLRPDPLVPDVRPALGGDPMRPHAIGAPLHCAPMAGRDPRLPPGRPHP